MKLKKVKRLPMQNKLLCQKPGAPDTLCFRLRDHLGLTQYKFAELVGCCGETIGLIERGGTPSQLVQRSLDQLSGECGITGPEEDR